MASSVYLDVISELVSSMSMETPEDMSDLFLG